MRYETSELRWDDRKRKVEISTRKRGVLLRVFTEEEHRFDALLPRDEALALASALRAMGETVRAEGERA